MGHTGRLGVVVVVIVRDDDVGRVGGVGNAARVLRDVDPELLVFDHHLLQERKYRKRTSDVWELREGGYDVQTVAELAEKRPLVGRLTGTAADDR